ncbi:DUF1636 domain-containing protein [Paracoccus sp. 11-3]|uniref:DUF1636 domain-containing protein n=1 Tax=Paracoccus amoyensis TaxID=2760093 RepID=A0A926G7I6_9RHOB|nr:DUF1636 domain-containing protein [Paracoccus amoyensis]MBC9245928.1 DUF1636 domain-containing protein [Paracoccus amoyensis]
MKPDGVIRVSGAWRSGHVFAPPSPVQIDGVCVTEAQSQVELLVCTRCCGSEGPNDTADRPGTVLLQALTDTTPEGVTIVPVECLSNCSRGCTIALRGPGRWTYIYGALDAASHLDTIRDGITAYLATPDGLVPWRQRPEHFRKNCIARIPPLERS